MKDLNPDFWKHTPLAKMQPEEWEALCDGCAKCCLHRLEDEDTREIYFTNVHCRLLDLETSQCKDYVNRSSRVPDCITITLKELEDPYWLPSTCAYRLLAEGKSLPVWHPLVSGDPATVFDSGNGITGRTVCEDDADNLEQHLIDWIR
ncbi:MAG TPA: YcgN family cysteine cluster protein [Chromatiaceae bacterium]|nr:YcgN family cysteine cluster protein [Chromatiaceae bacterium]